MNTCDFVIETLYKNNIDTYFVLSGGSIVPFIDAIAKNSKVKYFCFQHEQSAAMAAEGYFRSCGKIAAVCVTSGPGVQNILNGVCGCWYDSIPAFFITGQVNTVDDLTNFKCTPRQGGFQEMPVVDMFKHVTKQSLHVPNVNTISSILEQLITTVKTHRYGPVLMDFPVNIQMSTMCDNITQFVYRKPDVVDTTYDLSSYIECSQRPLIIFGHGIQLAKVEEKAILFAEKANIPFVVSWGAFDMCSTEHYLRVGSLGVYGDRHANFAVQNADLLIIMGSRMDNRQTGGHISGFSQYSKKIMIDIDAHEIEKMNEKGIHIDYKICTNLEDFFNHHSIEFQSRIDWNTNLDAWKKKYSIEKARDDDNVVYDYFYTFFDTLDSEAIVIPDTGGNLVWTMQTAKLNNTQNLFTNFGNSSMGFSLPCAIGAAIGSPHKKIYCISGDGGIQMNIQEMLTVQKYNLNIEIIVIDNRGYGIIKQFQDCYFKSSYTGTSKKDVFGSDVHFKKIADAYGIHNIQHVCIPENQKIYPKLEYGNALENMSPYIDFEHDMLVKVAPKKSLGWV